MSLVHVFLIVWSCGSQASNGAPVTPLPPKMTDFSINTAIISRYAYTKVTAIYLNEGTNSSEAQFTILLPLTAYIFNFTMTIDDQVIVSQVKEKDAAQKEYDRQKDQGKTTALVSSQQSSIRNMERFSVMVNVAAGKTTLCTLEYEQMMVRKSGIYNYSMALNPGQIVDKYEIAVILYQPQEITAFQLEGPKVLNLDSSQVTSSFKDANSKSLQLSLTKDQQNSISATEALSVTYDVKRTEEGGAIEIQDDVFVHYFSPPEDKVNPLEKNIIFVIDISGSMSGRKIEQTREAMKFILNQLQDVDNFDILIFDDKITSWKGSLQRASTDSIAGAQVFVEDKVVADGSTNIYGALNTAVNILKDLEKKDGSKIIVFLTDGQPSSGKITNTDEITEAITQQADEKVSIYSLAFGFGVNFAFLDKLSWLNKGFATQIYEGGDAVSQLENFYKEISAPLYYDIEFKYPTEVIANTVTKKKFPTYFNGSELLITGKILNAESVGWEAKVSANQGSSNIEKSIFPSANNLISLDGLPDALKMIMTPRIDKFLKRLWAYVRVRELVDTAKNSLDESERDLNKNQSIALALEYNMVTPFTSLVVIQPELAINEADGEVKIKLSKGRAVSFDLSGNNFQLKSANSRASMIRHISVHQLATANALVLLISFMKTLFLAS